MRILVDVDRPLIGNWGEVAPALVERIAADLLRFSDDGHLQELHRYANPEDDEADRWSSGLACGLSGCPGRWDTAACRRRRRGGIATMWTGEDIPSQHGRVAIVTGGNGGLGFEVARWLAGRGATVVIAARDQARAREARSAIAAETPEAALDVFPLELASLESVRTCAARLAADHSRVDLLINNAGIMGIPERRTVDDFEMQLGVNHLGHFALTHRLLPALLAAPAARVVSVTSFARFMGRTVRSENPHLRGRYNPWTAYAQSKLANLLFAVELQRRLEAVRAPVQSLAAHPGLSYTGLQAHSVEAAGGGLSQRFWYVAARQVGMRAERGALPLLRAATDPTARGGQLYGPRWLTFGPPARRPVFARPGRAGRTLWEVSERETGERFDVAAIVNGAG